MSSRLLYGLEHDDEFLIHHEFAERWLKLTHQQSAFFTIASLGFGSGFDFLMTWHYWLQYAPKSATLYYFSSELKPFSRDDLAKLFVYWPQLANQAREFLAAYPVLTPGFHQLAFEGGRVNLTLMLGASVNCFGQLLCCGDAETETKIRHYHIDAWYCHHDVTIDSALGASIAMLSKANTTLTSKRSLDEMTDELQYAGFKALTNHAIFNQSTQSSKQRYTPWHRHQIPTPSNKQAIVLGAGLAGCFMAWSLARRGWEILLVDEASQIASGASGNPQAILYPALSAFSSPFTDFMLSAYLFAHQWYSDLITTQAIGELSGILQLAVSPKEIRAQSAMKKWLACYPELGRLVSKDEASVLAGISVNTNGMYLPLSGWIDCRALCSYLAHQPGITIITDCQTKELTYDSGYWNLDHNYKARNLILANSVCASQFQQTAYLPLKPAAGQLTIMASNSMTKPLIMPICGAGHILPARQNQHVLGATYHPGMVTIPNANNDNQYNLNQINNLSPEIASCDTIVNHWQGVRATTSDYLPLVGPVPERESFLNKYASLATDSNRWLPYEGNYYPNLYVCAGFGSRGLTTIPLCTEWLARLINKEPECLPLKQIKSLSPARFLIKDIISPSKKY